MEQSRTLDLVRSMLGSPHGDLMYYWDAANAVANDDPTFYAHFIAYNHKHSKIRDSKVSLPVIGMRGPSIFSENGAAHLGMLGPRDLHRAVLFHKELNKAGRHIIPGHGAMLKQMLARYLRTLEANQPAWDAVTIQNRAAMVGLYALTHTKPDDRARAILFEKNYPPGSVFEAVKSLRHLEPKQAAAQIAKFNISAPIAMSAIGEMTESLMIALIDRMTGNQVGHYASTIQKFGGENSVVMLALEEALKRAQKDERVNVLKLEKSAKAAGGAVAKKLIKTQDAILNEQALKGRWLILFDRSGSMTSYISIAKIIGAALARFAEKTHLLFFDTAVISYNVTGKTLAEIDGITKGISPGGRTSIGCGLKWALRENEVYDAIVIISDGLENARPGFAPTLAEYRAKFSVDPAIYYIKVGGGAADVSHFVDTKVTDPFVIDTRARDFDYYSLPNLMSMMGTDRYKLLDDILATPLVSMDEVSQLKVEG